LTRLYYTIDEACRSAGLNRPTIYRLILRGELSAFKVGARMLILASVLNGFLERTATGGIALREMGGR
jgi:excisionase family DNA binding protein